MHVSLLILALVAISNSGVNAKPPSKIVGGQPLNITEAPFIVMIRHRLSYNATYAGICGGTVISNRHILTAAHCFEKDETDTSGLLHPKWFDVIVGESSYHPNVIIYNIEEVYSHPNYTPTFDYGVNDRADIAVVKLKYTISFDKTQQPVELGRKEPSISLVGFSYGWGATSPDGKCCSSYLQGIMLKVNPLEDCKRLFPELPFARDELCVVTFFGNGGVCHGDSGGPLIINGNLAGVITSGSRCDLGVVSNIARHNSWIEDVVNGTAEAVVHFAKDVADIPHDVQTSRPNVKREKPYVRDELSSRYPLHMINEHDNSGKE